MATLKNLTISDTGFIQLPTGTTAQRPVGPTAGMIRFNTDTRTVETYTAAGWVSSSKTQTATGGTITSVGGYTIHTFTSDGTFTPSYSGVVDILLVGAGGAGGAGIGGGGGGGGLIFNTGSTVNSGTAYPITVGTTSPAPGPGHGPVGATGIPTTGLGITANGGGGGCGYYGPGTPSPSQGDGGSGAGGPGYGYATGVRPAGIGFGGQGHPGGYGYHGPHALGTVHAGGGGGGAGEPGYNVQGMGINTAGAGTFPALNGPAQRWDVTHRGQASGGNGIANTISGAQQHYSGGGGGGTHTNHGIGRNNGGMGGGGHCNGPGPNTGTGGTYYGGGGGAGSHPDPSAGGTGYQGIVIVRYQTR